MNLQTWGPLAVLAVLVIAPVAIKRLKPEWIEQAVRRIMPRPVEELAVKAAMDAYRVVEQKTRKLAEKSDEDRLAQARQIFDALYELYRHGSLSDLAREALIELELSAQHQGAPSEREAVPLAEEAR